jgi:predicted amidohydrolase
MTSTPDKEANFSVGKRLVEAAREGGASMVFLPEAFDYIGSSRDETLALAESLTGDTISRYTQLARLVLFFYSTIYFSRLFSIFFL